MVSCPRCAATGSTSEVSTIAARGSTLAWQPHVDAAGQRHEHDPNVYRTTYRCSRGHEWTDRGKRPCPACGGTTGLGGPFRSS